MMPQTVLSQLVHWESRAFEVRTDWCFPQALGSISPLLVHYKVLGLDYLDSVQICSPQSLRAEGSGAKG